MDGRRRWHFDGPVADFAYLSGVVVVREGDGSGGTATYAALDPQTGKKLWRRTLPSSSPSPLYAGPDGTLYADLRSGTENKDRGSVSSRILQLRADTGKTVHQVEAPKRDLAAVHDGTAYYLQQGDTGVSGRLTVQNLTTGKTRGIDLPWSVKLETPPVVDGSTIYFFDNGYETILALDLDSGKPLWTSSRELRIFDKPAVYDNRLYVTMPNTSVLVLDARTGKQLWRTKTSFDTGDRLFNELRSTGVAPLVVGDTVYGVTAQGAFSVSAHRPDV
ncbi:PQQ-binding-like beta-propeller repeat protein [Streptomyces sp. NPDC002659]|uniref:outer membrane protein assembly factor BamB family protein n=1 Tax=Streptomyces sp. NPDC002659 TaxID=3364656 RepID=UPI0036A91DC2